MSILDALEPYATYALPALVALILLAFLIREVRNAPLVDSHGLPVDPEFNADVDQAIANVTTHELTGGAR